MLSTAAGARQWPAQRPGKDVRVGTQLQISKEGLEWQIEVCAAAPAQTGAGAPVTAQRRESWCREPLSRVAPARVAAAADHFQAEQA